jgi:starvation-inducible DNA-binding protein
MVIMSKKEKTNEQANKNLIQELNKVLATYQLFYQNLRGVHWNIKGNNFFALHVKFEELYTDAQLKIDEIAERILTLGNQPLHSFSDYLKTSEIKESKNISEDKEAVKMIVSNLGSLLKLEKHALKYAEDDESTQDLLTQFIAYQEKTLWMFKAWLG